MLLKDALIKVSKCVLYTILFCAGMLYGVMYALGGHEPFSHMKRAAQAKCAPDLSREVTHIDFVGRDLYLPSRHMHQCIRLDFSSYLDHDPASVSLVGMLPGFSVPDFVPSDYLKNEDEVRIHFSGSSRDPQGNVPAAEEKLIDLDAEFKRLLATKIKKDGGVVPRYEEGRAVNGGLVFYKTKATGQFAKDLYVHRDENQKVDFMIECYNRNKQPPPSVLYCASVEESLYDNVTYKYAFTLKHIAQAQEIDRLVNIIVQDAKVPKQ